MIKRILFFAGGLAGGILFLEVALHLPWGGLWNSRFAADPGAIRILALGESTTQGGFTRAENYPGVLETLLRSACPLTKIEVWNAGLAGARSSDIRRDLPTWLEKTKPQIATIMMGINDLQGTGGPVEVVGRSRWRVVRFFEWVKGSLKKRLEPKPELKNAKQLGELERWDYFRLVTQALRNQNRIDELEPLHREVLRVNPGSRPAALDLGNLLRGKGAFNEALEWHTKARPNGSVDPWVEWEILVDLNLLHREKDVLSTMDSLIKDAATLPMPVVTNLLDFLARAKDTAREARLLDEASKRELGQMILRWKKAQLLSRLGQEKDYKKTVELATAASQAPYPDSLVQNYQAIVRELEAEGAAVIPLTYPRQDPGPLHGFLPNVYSLEKTFEEAINKEGYAAIFYDSFGGNFGHLTIRGNEILAIALRDELLKREPLKSNCKLH